ncbi:MAG TPA: acetate--CoA ligase family protein [Candidatus Methanofastidiosa archaeon]|nr:acetate--CoA ligase family protein [Candidatus Methanofastidiosa archaeon]HPR41897.1 acetate--CoA ligase family protein [Candidatus Methanofastidiosa archaeon]
MHPLIQKAKEENRSLLENEAREILKLYGINVPPYRVASNEDEAADFAKELGYPVAMKILSPQILHKSDAGGVVLDIKNSAEARSAYAKIIVNAMNYDKEADLLGVLISPMMRQGVEVIIGMTQDPQFGPVIMFGLGGIFVEVFKDVSFRVTPVDRVDASEMVREIKAYPILTGIRGERPKDIDALIDLILKVSDLSDEHSEIRELDLNPVFVYDQGVSVVDARIIL